MTLTDTPRRISPVHDELQHLHARFVEVADMPVAVAFGDAASERQAAADLALCDVSFLPRVTLKGSAAASLLGSQQISVPDKVFDVFAMENGVVARTGGSEFFIEAGLNSKTVERLTQAARGTPDCYVATRQDAAFLLCGSRAADVLLETCGYDFRRPPQQIVFTRVAGVSCSIWHRTFNGIGAFQLWLDGSYGEYLWHTLLEIVKEMNGAAVGAAAFYPELVT